MNPYHSWLSVYIYKRHKKFKNFIGPFLSGWPVRVILAGSVFFPLQKSLPASCSCSKILVHHTLHQAFFKLLFFEGRLIQISITHHSADKEAPFFLVFWWCWPGWCRGDWGGGPPVQYFFYTAFAQRPECFHDFFLLLIQTDHICEIFVELRTIRNMLNIFYRLGGRVLFLSGGLKYI